MNHVAWNRWVPPLKIVVMVALLVWLARKIDLGKLVEVLVHADPIFLTTAAGLGAAMVALRVHKWQALLNSLPPSVLEQRVSFRQAWVSMLGGMAFGLVTPARAGELGRIAFLPKRLRPVAGGLFVVDRGIDLVTILMTAVVGSAGVLSFAWQVALLAALAAMVAGTAGLPILVPLALEHVPFPQKIRALMTEMSEGLAALRMRDLLWNLVLGLGLMALDVVSLYVLVRTFEPVAWNAVTFVFPLVLLTNLVPVTPSGIGVREGAAVYLFKPFGVSEAAAFNSALLFYVVNSFLPGLWGILYVRRIGSETNAEPAGETP